GSHLWGRSHRRKRHRCWRSHSHIQWRTTDREVGRQRWHPSARSSIGRSGSEACGKTIVRDGSQNIGCHLCNHYEESINYLCCRDESVVLAPLCRKGTPRRLVMNLATLGT